MSGVVQEAQKILQNYRGAIEHPNSDFDKAQNLMIALDFMQAADFYEIDQDISLYLEDAKEELLKGCTALSEIRVPVDARPPSDICFVYMKESGSAFLVKKYEAGEAVEGNRFDPSEPERAIEQPCVAVVRVGAEYEPLQCGGYIMSDKEQDNAILMGDVSYENPEEKDQNGLENYLAGGVMSMALTMTLINQPRFVVQGAAGSRQSRKHMHRKHGIATGAWHKIQWNLGEPVKAKSDSDRGGWRMPLHYTRGHWRKAQDHWDDVVIRKDNQPYKWIDGFWSGHPAYGVKKSYHAPKLGKKELVQ